MQNKVLKEMERSIVTKFLDIVILAELKNGSSLSGYDVINFVHKKFGFLISPGTIYSLLYSLERRGLVKGAYSQAKRIYRLTYEGEENIEAILKSKDEIQRFIGSLY